MAQNVTRTPPKVVTVRTAILDTSTLGANAIVAAPASSDVSIRVLSLVIVAAAANTVNLQSTTTTSNKTSLFALAANGAAGDAMGGRTKATDLQGKYLKDRFARDSSQNYQNNISLAAGNIQGALGQADGEGGPVRHAGGELAQRGDGRGRSHGATMDVTGMLRRITSTIMIRICGGGWPIPGPGNGPGGPVAAPGIRGGREFPARGQSRSSRVQTASCSRFTGNFGTGE